MKKDVFGAVGGEGTGYSTTVVHMFGELQEGEKVWEDLLIMLSLTMALHAVGKPPRLTIQFCSRLLHAIHTRRYPV